MQKKKKKKKSGIIIKDWNKKISVILDQNAISFLKKNILTTKKKTNISCLYIAENDIQYGKTRFCNAYSFEKHKFGS